MNDQEKLWSSDWGNKYTDRNRVDWRARIPFWKRVINETGARSVTEIGCNAGWNLSAIRRAYPDVHVRGVEINHHAGRQAFQAGIPVFIPNPEQDRNLAAYPQPGGGFVAYPEADLVFTAGVLIHQNADALKTMMERIVAASFQYVLAVEYPADKEEPVKYRGMDGHLWRRPYGRLYKAMGLKEVESWPLTHQDGFDNCQAWIFTKF